MSAILRATYSGANLHEEVWHLCQHANSRPWRGELFGAAAQNTDRIAVLKWYGANLVTTFTVENSPLGVAFDGANIWVVDGGNNTVTVMRASNGVQLATFDLTAFLSRRKR